jgi:dolichol-phosphate mannosyltransferase
LFLISVLIIISDISLFSYEIIFVLDPSIDRSEEIISNQIKLNKNIKMLVLSRRFGQPSATMAGILNCNGRTCVIIDVDLQDPPELIENMYFKFQEGYDVVLARRISRQGETFIKKIVTKIGYRIINYASDVDIPNDTGDFRLISRRVIDHLKQLNEPHNFLRGLVSYIGFKQCFIEYNRDSRYSGRSKYNPFFGSIKIALNGLISFSSKPLYLMTGVGFFLSIFSFFLGFWYFIQKILEVDITPGLPTNVLLITFFSGIQLLALGLIGEYVGRIYDQVKQRPSYIIEKKINFDE